jgi:hypothetical protein
MIYLNQAKAINTLHGHVLQSGGRLTAREKAEWKKARSITPDGIDDQASWEAACDFVLALVNEVREQDAREVFEMSEAVYKPLEDSQN